MAAAAAAAAAATAAVAATAAAAAVWNIQWELCHKTSKEERVHPGEALNKGCMWQTYKRLGRSTSHPGTMKVGLIVTTWASIRLIGFTELLCIRERGS